MRTFFIVTAVLGTIAISGCVSPPPPPPEPARVRVANAEIDAFAFDVCVGQEVVLENSRFGEITAYAEVVAGELDLDQVVAGSDCDDLINSVFGGNASVDLAEGSDNTLVLLADGDSGFELLDDNSATDANRARIRLVNASEDSLSLDLIDDGGAALFSQVRYNEPGDYGYIQVVSGTYNLSVTPLAGEMTPFALNEVAFDAGSVYTLFAVGRVDGEGEAFDVVVVLDSSPGVTG